MNKTMFQILKETVDFYSEDPENRSVGRYNSTETKHCAIGRCLTSESRKKGEELLGNASDVLELVCENDLSNLDEILSQEYRGHSLLFWQDLQNLHDLECYWTDSGLSEKGHLYVEKMEQRIESNYY